MVRSVCTPDGYKHEACVLQNAPLKGIGFLTLELECRPKVVFIRVIKIIFINTSRNLRVVLFGHSNHSGEVKLL